MVIRRISRGKGPTVRTLCCVWRSSGAGLRVQQDALCDLDTKKGFTVPNEHGGLVWHSFFGHRNFEPQITALALEVHFLASMKMQENAFRIF